MNVIIRRHDATASNALQSLGHMLWTRGKEVNTGHWQALKNVPHTKTIELTNVQVSFENMPSTVEGLQLYFEPNLPWSEDHFQERVSGEPLNPGKEYRNWPWYAGGVEGHRKFKCPECGTEFRGRQDIGYPCLACGAELPAFDTQEAKFSHTYMERFWPKWAGTLEEYYFRRKGSSIEGRGPRGYHDGILQGIRYRYGDLNDLIDLLAREPYTRQAYLPMWFPEDTGAHHRERVPCSLGYHFMLREGKLNIFYPMRSCDFLRYMRDDCYLAARLGLWIIAQVQEATMGDISGPPEPFDHATLGHLNFFASSLHIFEGDLPKMRREYG